MRLMIPLLCLAGGCSAVVSEPNAPFPLRGRTQLWLADPASDETGGAALLLLTDDDMTCDDIDPEALGGEGRGLALSVRYDATGEATFGSNAFAGLYASGTTTSFQADGSRERSLTPSAWDDGFLLELSDAAGDSWLLLDEVDADRVRGDFATPWWRGRIAAEVCEASGTVAVGNACERFASWLETTCDLDVYTDGQAACEPGSAAACTAECGLKADCIVFSTPDDPTAQDYLDAVQEYTDCIVDC